jgi:hypothetical protein
MGLWELRAPVEGDLHRGAVGRKEQRGLPRLRRPLFLGAVGGRLDRRIDLAVRIDIGPSVTLALLELVQLLLLFVVSEVVDSVIDSP